jgi:hypothetical protein
MVACLTAAVVLGIRMTSLAATFPIRYAYEGIFYDYDLQEMFDRIDELPQIPSEVGCAIAAAWVVQWASGRWRPEAYWIDRLGRALGFLWIATIPFSAFSWST